MKAYIDKTALIAEIEKELNTTKKYSTEYVNGKKYALKKILSFLDTLEVKEEVLDRNDKTKLMRKCVKTAYKRGYDMGVLQTTNKINHNTKEVEEEPVSEDLGEAANTYVDNWYKLNNLDKESYPIDVEISKNDFKAGAKWQKEQMITKACNYLFSHMGLFVTFFDDDIVEDIERSEFIKKFRIAMEDKL